MVYELSPTSRVSFAPKLSTLLMPGSFNPSFDTIQIYLDVKIHGVESPCQPPPQETARDHLLRRRVGERLLICRERLPVGVGHLASYPLLDRAHGRIVLDPGLGEHHPQTDEAVDRGVEHVRLGRL